MKLLTNELALELTKMLLQNDKDVRDDLQEKIDAISNGAECDTPPTITLARTPEDDGVVITITDSNGTSSTIINDGLNGKNVQVAKIEPIVDGNKITFTYFNNDNIQQISELEVMNGKDGISISNAKVNAENELVLTLSDDTEINAGKIYVTSGDVNLENYYDSNTIDEMLLKKEIEIKEYVDLKLEEVNTASPEDINNLFL